MQRKEAQKRGQEFMQGNFKSSNMFGGGGGGGSGAGSFSGQQFSSSSFESSAPSNISRDTYT